MLRRSFRGMNRRPSNGSMDGAGTQRRPSMDGDFTQPPPQRRPGGSGGYHMRRPQLGKFGKSMGQSMRRIGQQYRRQEEEAPFWTWWRICGYCLPVLLLLGCSGALVYFTGNVSKLTELAQEGLNKLAPKLGNEDLDDPLAGKTLSEVARWDSSGNGLELEFVNACDPKWATIFNLALSNWDLGSPDSVTLAFSNADYDMDCEFIDGKVKVCSGNYGGNNWRGINSAIVDGDTNIITASAAKMNEHYLVDGPDEDGAKQYTMCHEMGHALGLPHTDEDFENDDLGNCLDYTNNFKDNENPDAMNYESLLELYGAVGVRKHKQRQLLRHRRSTDRKKIPDAVRTKFRQVVSELEQKYYDSQTTTTTTTTKEDATKDKQHHGGGGWRLLHQSKHGEEHEMDLGQGYKARVQMLLVHHD